MLAVTGELPPDDPRWAYEPKWDGVRVVACLGDGEARLWSRLGNQVTVSYPELARLTRLLSVPAVLDGEVVAFDERGRPDFGLLQHRMHLTRPADVTHARRTVPVTYVAFDLLHLGGHDTVALPYRDRRALLADLDLERGGGVHVPPYSEGHGAAMVEATLEHGLEGVVAKRMDSTYVPGRRVDTWRKMKHQHTRDVLVAGWLPGEGRREGTIGAIVMALPDGAGVLRHVGQVGTGFSDQVLDDLHTLLAAEETATGALAGQLEPAAERVVHWVEPRRVAEVRYTNWTRDGRLRAAVWRGLRPDVDPAEVEPHG
ncbi:MAG: non-homologous end-joining DNA ligase [Streptosporangiales bacterium]|nr:non-homologous end-joining DNA ligase [Streptosporangiales bacterium]